MTARAIPVVAVVLAATTIGALLGHHRPTNSPPAPRAQPKSSTVPDVGPAQRRTPTSASPAGSARPDTAAAAVRRYAARYATWSWRHAGTQQRQLAGLAMGELARTVRASARTSSLDARLRRDQPSSRGSVQAIQLGGRGPQRHALVVTREQTFSHGIPDEGGPHWHVYTATLHQQQDGWALTSWQAQP